jgi:hypothetical protein
MNARYPLVSRRAGHRCEYCHAPEAVFNFPFEIEHVIPTSRQGPDDDTNLALACRACNLHKTDQLTAEDIVTGTAVLLFHPRRDVWSDHFQVDRESGTIHGATPTGRATLALLKMNTPLQLAARKQWMLLGLFP